MVLSIRSEIGSGIVHAVGVEVNFHGEHHGCWHRLFRRKYDCTGTDKHEVTMVGNRGGRPDDVLDLSAAHHCADAWRSISRTISWEVKPSPKTGAVSRSRSPRSLSLDRRGEI